MVSVAVTRWQQHCINRDNLTQSVTQNLTHRRFESPQLIEKWHTTIRVRETSRSAKFRANTSQQIRAKQQFAPTP